MKIQFIPPVLASLFLMQVACENEKNETKDPHKESCVVENLSFGDCIRGSQKVATSNPATIRLSYQDSNLLKIELFNTEFCCGTDSIAIMDSIADHHILLDLVDEGPYTWCFCFHDVTFNLGPIAEGEYSLTFTESENSYVRDTFNIDFIFNADLDTTILKESPPEPVFEEFDLEEIIKGGCNSKSTFQDDPYEQIDTIIFSPENDTLNVFVGVNYVCCYNFTSASYFEADTLIIDLNASTDAPCDCMCYYTFDFIYSDYHNQQFFYQVLINDALLMEGFYDPDL